MIYSYRYLLLVLVTLKLANAAQNCELECEHLDSLPSEFSEGEEDVPILALSCGITTECHLDINELVANYSRKYNIDLRSNSTHLSADIYFNCVNEGKLLDFSCTSTTNKTLLTTIRLQDCNISWSDVEYLGRHVYLHRVQSVVTSSTHIIKGASENASVEGLTNIRSLEFALHNFTEKVDLQSLLHSSQRSVLKNIVSFHLQCFKEIGDQKRLVCNPGTVLFYGTMGSGTFPRLQSLELVGVYQGNDLQPLNFPWNSESAKLPRNLSYSAYYRNLNGMLDWVRGNFVKRALSISHHFKINVSNVCSMNGSLNEVILTNDTLTDIPSGCFKYITNLFYLDMSCNQFSILPVEIFDGLSSLQTLHLAGAQLDGVQVGLFDDLINLRFLSLHHNNLGKLKTGLLFKLRAVRTLWIHTAKLVEVESGSLPVSSDQLTHIDFRWNNLLEVPLDCLTLPNLHKCDCDSNDISLNITRLIKYFNPIKMNLVQPHAYYNEPYSYIDVAAAHETSQSEISIQNCNVTEISYEDTWTIDMKKRLAAFLGFYQITLGRNNNGEYLQCDCSLFHLQNYIVNEAPALITSFYPHVLGLSYSNFRTWICVVNSLVNDETPDKRKFPFLDVEKGKFLCRNNTMPYSDQCVYYTKPLNKSILVDCRNRLAAIMPKELIVPPDGNTFTVHLEDTGLQSLPSCYVEGYGWLKHVTSLYLNENELSTTANDLEIFLQCLPNIQHLSVANNHIQSLPLYIQSKKFRRLTISGNPLKCCEPDYWMKLWLQDNNQTIHNSTMVYCDKDRPIVQLEQSAFVCSSLTYIPPLVSVVCLLITTVIVSIALQTYRFEVKIILFEKLNWHPFHKRNKEEEKEYDAYLMYCDKDYRWAHKTLLKGLEKLGYRTFLMNRDSHIGACTAEELATAFSKTHRVIVVVSQSFIDDEDRMGDFFFAYEHDKALMKGRFLILIKLEENIDFKDCGIFKQYVNTNYFIPLKVHRFWSRLRYWLPEVEDLPAATDHLRPLEEEEEAANQSSVRRLEPSYETDTDLLVEMEQ